MKKRNQRYNYKKDKRILKKKNEEFNDSGRRIRTFNRKKAEENKEENNEEKRDIH